MHWPHWLAYQNSQDNSGVLETWGRKKNKKVDNYGFSITGNQWIQGFYWNNMPKKAGIMSGWHHAMNYHHFPRSDFNLP